MTHAFTMELRSQQEWSWLLALDLFFGGLGGGLFLLKLYFDLSPLVGLLAICLVALGGVVLLIELGHPQRAWRALARPLTSWISRGMIFVTLFIIAGLLSLAPAFESFAWLPWMSQSPVGNILLVIAGVCAFFVTLYPGFILSASPSIPLWNSPILPLLFVSHSALGASGVVLLISPVASLGQSLESIGFLTALLIVANFVMIAIYLLTLKGSGLAAREAVRLLNRGALGLTLQIGVGLVGMLLPLVVVLWVPSAAVLAGVFILVGAILFRYCVLKAGVYVPFPLV